MAKLRADLLLVEQGLAPSRERAQALIRAGQVMADGKPVTKPAAQLEGTAALALSGEVLPFVSRGGLKLDKAVRNYALDLTGVTAMDVGASTGGFTDCMLRAGAAHVYAIDVGTNQLAASLRADPRVTVMERTNARYMEPAWFSQRADFASIDVSFISLKLILPPLLACLTDGGEVAALIKPQFEAGRSQVGKNGVVRDAAVHASVCGEIIRFAADAGYGVRGLSFSPITGPKGNIEFLLHLQKTEAPEQAVDPEMVERIVQQAHRATLA